MSAKIADFKDGTVPTCMYWTGDEVAEWIGQLGFPMYKDCFITNNIDGRRLILVNASTLPDLGITDFDHIRTITAELRNLQTLEDPFWNRSISLPPRDNLGMYLEMKSRRGKEVDAMSYPKFSQDADKIKWEPPLANHCLIIPHN